MPVGGGTSSGVVFGWNPVVKGVPITDRFAFDLPDSGFLFPGDIMHYYIEATDIVGMDTQTATLPDRPDRLRRLQQVPDLQLRVRRARPAHRLGRRERWFRAASRPFLGRLRRSQGGGQVALFAEPPQTDPGPRFRHLPHQRPQLGRGQRPGRAHRPPGDPGLPRHHPLLGRPVPLHAVQREFSPGSQPGHPGPDELARPGVKVPVPWRRQRGQRAGRPRQPAGQRFSHELHGRQLRRRRGRSPDQQSDIPSHQ